jgi:hypothetical protein
LTRIPRPFNGERIISATNHTEKLDTHVQRMKLNSYIKKLASPISTNKPGMVRCVYKPSYMEAQVGGS